MRTVHHIGFTCQVCGKTFLTQPKRVKRGPKFCSCECFKARTIPLIPLIDRFFRYVGKKQPNGCIPWTGTKNKKGYGRILSEKRLIVASRVSYELFVQPIPEGIYVLHHCDNPRCINPMHLFLGTRSENAADMKAKNRQSKGESHPSSRLTESQVVQMRKLRAAGMTIKDIANEYGIDSSTASLAIRRITWKHVERTT